MALILIFGTFMIAVAIAFLLALIVFFIRDKNKWIDDFVNNHDNFTIFIIFLIATIIGLYIFGYVYDTYVREPIPEKYEIFQNHEFNDIANTEQNILIYEKLKDIENQIEELKNNGRDFN